MSRINHYPKNSEGFLKVYYMEDREHHNKDFRYEYLEKKNATAILLFNNDYSKFFLVKQFRPGAKQDLWEIPAGILEEHLTPLENTLKEVEEETGYRKEDVIDIKEIPGAFPTPGYSTEFLYLFVGRIKEGAEPGKKNCDENECISGEGFFTYDEAVEIGGLKDMKTALAYYYFQCMGKK